jgi:excisionase family DNA binding protein
MDTITDVIMEDEELLTVIEVAAWLKITKAKAQRLCRDGEIEATKVGREFRITRDAVRRYLRRDYRSI